MMEESSVGQAIEENKGEISIFNLLDNFKIDLTLTATFFSFLGTLAIAVLINELSRRIRFDETVVRRASRRAPKLLQRIASAVSSFEAKRPSAITVFAIFVHLFIWVTQLFLTNNIKVEVSLLSQKQVRQNKIYHFFRSHHLWYNSADQIHNTRTQNKCIHLKFLSIKNAFI